MNKWNQSWIPGSGSDERPSDVVEPRVDAEDSDEPASIFISADLEKLYWPEPEDEGVDIMNWKLYIHWLMVLPSSYRQ